MSQLSAFTQNNNVPQHSVECVGRPKRTQIKWKTRAYFLTARRAWCMCGVEEKGRAERSGRFKMSKCPRRTCLSISVLETPLKGNTKRLPRFKGQRWGWGWVVTSLDSISPAKEQTRRLKSLARPRDSIRRRDDSSGAPSAHTFYIFTGDISSFLPFSLMT